MTSAPAWSPGMSTSSSGVVAKWDLDLEPHPGHFDRRITVTTPLQAAGVICSRQRSKAETPAGSWSGSTTLSSSRSHSETGPTISSPTPGLANPYPVPTSNFFDGGVVQIKDKNQFRIETKALSLRTDDDGQFQVADTFLEDGKGLITAKTLQGRRAHLGFPRDFLGSFVDINTYNQVKIYVVTDRPVYRPGDTVRFKFWAARARYDQSDPLEFANRRFQVGLYDSKYEIS